MAMNQEDPKKIVNGLFYNASTLEFIKTFLLHLLSILLLCYLYQGFFLFLYPPLLGTWILISLVLSQLHLIIHRRVTLFYFGEHFLTQLWLNPLLLLVTTIALTLLCFMILDYLGMAAITRQFLQLSVDLFSKFLYIYFLLIFASSTYLFIELSIQWIPRLQQFHFAKASRRTARRTLLGLTILVLVGCISLYKVKHQNLVYIKALLVQNLAQDYQKTIELLSQIRPDDHSLYLNAQYRLARIMKNRYHRYGDAIKHFQIITNSVNSPLKESAILEILTCLFQDGKSSETMEKFLQLNVSTYSCLKDEMQFLLATKYEMEGLLLQAQKLYQEMSQYPSWTFTLKYIPNSQVPQYERTAVLAYKHLLALKYIEP